MNIRSKFVNGLLPLCKHLGGFGRRLGVSLKYYLYRHRWPNLRHPHNLSEHILSNICKPNFVKYADLVDKVKVHDYIKSKGLGDILLTHYAVWDKPEDIDITNLPEKFILKPNNGSGGHVYCRDKKNFDLESAKKQLSLSLYEDYFFEPQYTKVVPKVFAEELLDLGEGKGLTDYKFTCIKGQIIDIFLAEEKEHHKRKYATVDIDWNVLPYTDPAYLLKPLPPRPKHIEEMAEYAKILSKDFDFVRVDFYEYNDKVYFGELTFSPWGGYMYSYTDEAIEKLGKYFD